MGQEKFKNRKFLSDLCSRDDSVKWAAVEAMGKYVSELAEKNLEAARNWMRRFIWQLNAESGNIGWGIPEVMGEIMARREGLAREFSPILVSYIREDGNFLEYEPLQRGVVWGIARLAQVRPLIVESMHLSPDLLPLLRSPDATIRGLSAWLAGLVGAKEAERPLEGLMNDGAIFQTFLNGVMVTVRVQEFAGEAWNRIQERKASLGEKTFSPP